MLSLKCILLVILFFSHCGARKKNSLDEIQGPWMIRNASENVFPLMGDCPSVDIESPTQKSENNEAIITLKTVEKKYIFTIVAIDKTTYEIYYPQPSNDAFLGHMTVLKQEKREFLITQVERQDEVYFVVLANENVSSDVDRKVEKFWNSSKPTKQVPLLPTRRENCDSGENETSPPISGVYIEEISLDEKISPTEKMMQDAPPPQIVIIPIIQLPHLNETRVVPDEKFAGNTTETSNQIPLNDVENNGELNRKQVKTPSTDVEIDEKSSKIDTAEEIYEDSNNTEDYGNVTMTPSSAIIIVPSSILIIISSINVL